MATSVPSEDDPSPLEKSNQLERILLSSTFKKQLKPATLLNRLVTLHLSGEVIDEDPLGTELHERPKNWVPIEQSVVRQNALRLRQLLEKYYLSEGIGDRLNLEVSGYQVIFSYNPRHPVERDFRRALLYVSSDARATYSLIDAILAAEPDHAEALALKGETGLWHPMAGNEVGTTIRVEEAKIYAQQSLRYDPDCWRAHVVMGVVYCCHFEWSKAKKSFAFALSSAPKRTSFHPWYAAYLMAIGRIEEALDLAKARANEPSDMPWPQLTYAIFLYAARRFHEARTVMLRTDKGYTDTWQLHVAWACLFAIEANSVPPPFRGMSLQQEMPNGTSVYTGLTILEHMRRIGPEHEDYRMASESFDAWMDVKREAMDSPDEDPLYPYREMKVCPSHLAIAYMAFGKTEEAIEMLERDMENGHPLMVWLHLWPLLDPLRDHPAFKRLIRRMKLPR